MTRTPASELARVKREFPLWTIRGVEPGKGTGFTAHRRAAPGLRNIYAPTLAELEARLLELHFRRERHGR